MPDHPFEGVREALLRLGVAPRHARRAVVELDSHFHQLVHEGLQRGDSEEAWFTLVPLMSFIAIFLAAIAILAYRQRIALHWPVAGIAIVCCLVALMNASVVLTGGTPPGSVGAGIGISTHSVPVQMMHAVSMMVLVVGPLWIVWRRHRLDGATVD